MISKIKNMYPRYIILTKKEDKFFNAVTNCVVCIEKIKKPYIVINGNSYEVHKS